MTKRLFTFGCSMTKYYYPTWADIIGQNWEVFENWGQAGGGNHFIFNSVIECNARNKFTCDDTVMVMWSGLSRIDAYQFNKWVHLHHKYPDHFDYACCPDGYEVISYAYMCAIEQLLDKSGCNYQLMRWGDYDTTGPAGIVYKTTIDRLKPIKFSNNRRLYNKTSSSLEFQTYWSELYSQLAGPDWPSLEKIYNQEFADLPSTIVEEVQDFLRRINQDKKWMSTQQVDGHPSPLQHLDMVRKYFPEVVVSNETVSWITDTEQQLLDGTVIQKYNQHIPPERL